jgi:hypothetical protein
MAELIVNISGAQSYKLDLSIYDSGVEGESDVWKGVFTDTENGDSYEVYFEAESEDLEIWDVIDLAITAYRDTIDVPEI